MKKRGILLGIFVVFCMMVMPTVKAADVGLIFGSLEAEMTNTTMNTGETANSKSISVVNKGAQSEVYIGVKALTSGGGIASGTEFTAKLSLAESDWKYVSNDSSAYADSGWTVTVTKVSDTEVNIKATATKKINAGEKAIITKITLDGSKAAAQEKACRITLGRVDPEVETPTCKKDGDTYYCASGATCTEEEYKKQCTTAENPQTGSFLPYAVIIGGIAVAAGLYMMTKKNKIYHI